MMRAWLVLGVCFLMLMVGAGPVYYAYGNYALAWEQEFGAPRSVINIGFTMVSLMGNVCAAPIGTLTDRMPVRYLTLFGVLGTAIGYCCISLASGIWPIIILFSSLIALADICLGAVITNYILAHWFERRRALALGLSLTGASLAGVLFPPLTDYLIGHFGWRTAFLAYACLMLALLPAIWFLARLPAAMPEAERLPPSPHVPTAPMPVRALLALPAFWIISVGCGAVTGANTGLVVSLVGFAKGRGLSTAEGSYLISVLAIFATLGKGVFGLLADRFGYRLALQIGIACALAGNVVLIPAAGYGHLLAGAAIFGLGLGSILPVWGASLAATVGLPSFGRALGWSRMIWAPISMLFPMLAGWSFDRTGDYSLAWTLFAVLLAGPLVATFFWRTGPLRAVRV